MTAVLHRVGWPGFLSAVVLWVYSRRRESTGWGKRKEKAIKGRDFRALL